MPGNAEYRLYLGSYTGPEFAGRGIGVGALDSAGRPRVDDLVTEVEDPSFLALSPRGDVLYAVNEHAEGRVVAFEVRPDGALHELNSQSTMGSAPCHLSVHPSGKFLLTANYLSGNLVVHPIGEGGVLREPCHVVQHSGSGPNRQRQSGPHAHQVIPDPSGRHVLAADLGTDTVYVYDFDERTGHLAVKEEAALRPGSGPRHLAFHPSGDRLYLISELTSTMTEIGYEAETGALTIGETLSTLPDGYTGPTLAAEVDVSPDGRFVFGSNRGHDSIAVFDASDFRLLGISPLELTEPRHFCVTPTGTLIVAGQNSSALRAYRVSDAGELIAEGDSVPAPCPVCVLAVPV